MANEPRQYTPWEIAKLTLVCLDGMRTGPTAKLDRRIDRVQAKAVEREAIRDAARAQVKAEKEQAKFDAKVAKAKRRMR